MIHFSYSRKATFLLSTLLFFFVSVYAQEKTYGLSAAEIGMLPEQSRFSATDLGLSVKWGGFVSDTHEWSGERLDKSASQSVKGEGWRMPTKKEMQELIDKCDWEFSYKECIVYGPNGNSISIRNRNFQYGKSETYYWCGDCDKRGNGYCLYIQFGKGTGKASIKAKKPTEKYYVLPVCDMRLSIECEEVPVEETPYANPMISSLKPEHLIVFEETCNKDKQFTIKANCSWRVECGNNIEVYPRSGFGDCVITVKEKNKDKFDDNLIVSNSNGDQYKIKVSRYEEYCTPLQAAINRNIESAARQYITTAVKEDSMFVDLPDGRVTVYKMNQEDIACFVAGRYNINNRPTNKDNVNLFLGIRGISLWLTKGGNRANRSIHDGTWYMGVENGKFLYFVLKDAEISLTTFLSQPRYGHEFMGQRMYLGQFETGATNDKSLGKTTCHVIMSLSIVNNGQYCRPASIDVSWKSEDGTWNNMKGWYYDSYLNRNR